MHSFKQFLKENNSNEIKVRLLFTFAAGTSISEASNIENKIRTYCKDNFKSHTLIYRIDNDDMYIKFMDFDEQNANQNYFKSEVKKLLNFLDTNSISFSSSHIYTACIPTHKIEADDIHFHVGTDSTKDLSNIYKFFECTHSFTISAVNRVEKSLLSVLKIKCKKLTIESNLLSNKAFQIVNKYVISRDILSCQDELIENGLEEYAQL